MRPWAILIAFIVGLFGSSAALAEKRVALIIGNSNYKNVAKLPNPVHDATAVAALLRSAGFDTVEAKSNLGIAELRRAIRDFSDTVADADVAVVFYAGHGIEVDGTNYLVPTDAILQRDLDVEDETVSLDRVLKVLEQAKRLRLVMLDACRDNPFSRSMKRTIATRTVGRGLARVEPASSNTLIAFAAKAGSVAADGDGTNSPFTTALLKYIAAPGLDLRLAFGRVRDDVMSSTRNQQEPFVYGSLGGSTVTLVPGAADNAPAIAARQPDGASFEIAFWETIKNDRNPLLFEAYLKRYPNGAFADIARISLKQQQTAALQTKVAQPNDKITLTDPVLLREVRERLYELNFDPGASDGQFTEAARQAIREFEQSNKLAVTGEATQGLLRTLRDIGALKPWGAIVYSKTTEKWGMAWSQDSRKAAVATARASCGDASKCSTEISFFGTECGAFAHSGTTWAMVARDDIRKAKDAATTDCRKRGKACRVIATVCADGAEQFRGN
jgi:hypothetical protein